MLPTLELNMAQKELRKRPTCLNGHQSFRDSYSLLVRKANFCISTANKNQQCNSKAVNLEEFRHNKGQVM